MTRIATVTGAGGFLGRALIARLLADGISVRAITRSPTLNIPGAEIARSPVLDVATLSACFRNADVVFHLAAHTHDVRSLDDVAAQEAITLGGTIAAIAAAECASVRHFIFVSSLAVHGRVGSSVATEDHPCNPTTPYGRAKLQSETVVQDYASRTSTFAACIRPAMIYGIGCAGNLPRMIHAIRRRRFPPLPEFGNRRSMVDVSDVVQALILSWKAGVRDGRPFIVTDGQPYSTRKIYDLIRESLGRSGRVVPIPPALFSAAARIGDIGGALMGRRLPFDSNAYDKLIGSAFFSSARAARELGFNSTTTLEGVLPAMIRHLAAESTSRSRDRGAM